MEDVMETMYCIKKRYTCGKHGKNVHVSRDPKKVISFLITRLLTKYKERRSFNSLTLPLSLPYSQCARPQPAEGQVSAHYTISCEVNVDEHYLPAQTASQGAI